MLYMWEGSKNKPAQVQQNRLHYSLKQPKGLTMIKRNIFTKCDIRDNGVLDLILALAIAGAGLVLALAYFDVLTK